MLQPSTPFGKAYLRLPAKFSSVLRLLGLLVGLLLFSHLSARADSGLYKDFIALQTGGTTTYYGGGLI